MKKPKKEGCWMKIFSTEDRKEDLVLIRYLNWCFRATFFRYMISALFLFFSLILVFALLYFTYEKIDIEQTNKCYEVLDQENAFAVAFGLSWTTFSTVGYGNITLKMENECFVLTFLCSLESFIGVLYAGFCGAILYGKVSKIYSEAMVRFSNKFVIRFGQNSHADHDDDDIHHDTPGTEFENCLSKSMVDTSFPILIFRIVNELANNESYGDIMNVEISATASIGSKIVMNSTFKNVLPKKYFRNVLVQPERVPVFSKAVYIRHHLNGTSHLLSKEIRRKIRRNGGTWPAELNSVEALKNALVFDELLVTLNGMSQISKSGVSLHKKYRVTDAEIGKQFVGLSHRNANGVVKVDFSKRDAIVDQTFLPSQSA